MPTKDMLHSIGMYINPMCCDVCMCAFMCCTVWADGPETTTPPGLGRLVPGLLSANAMLLHTAPNMITRKEALSARLLDDLFQGIDAIVMYNQMTPLSSLVLLFVLVAYGLSAPWSRSLV